MSAVVIETVQPVGGGSSGKSAVSWAAILAGAVVAAAASLVLLALGGGLEFASISPWPGHGISGKEFTVSTAIWLIVVQWVSAALGGYIAGRMRTKWVGTHTHEVFFRDTAHGFITWSVGTVFVAAMLASSATTLLGGGMRAMSSAGPGAAHMASNEPASGGGFGSSSGAMSGPGMAGAMPGPAAALTYDIDKLFRPATGESGATPGAAVPSGAAAAASGNTSDSGDARAEALYIALHAMATRDFSRSDRSYLAQLVQAQTGATAADAQRRVEEFASSLSNAEAKARQAADNARKAAAEASIYTALSMLIGAFIASVSAALGGRLRDEHI